MATENRSYVRTLGANIGIYLFLWCPPWSWAFESSPLPFFTEQVGRNQSADPTKRVRVPWAVLEPGWPILAKIAWKSHQWPMCTETTWPWKTWLEMPDTFFYLQRIVSQEALEPNPPLPHQSGWGSVNPTSSSFLRKIDLGGILPTSSAGTQWQAQSLLFPHVSGHVFQVRIGCCMSSI